MSKNTEETKALEVDPLAGSDYKQAKEEYLYEKGIKIGRERQVREDAFLSTRTKILRSLKSIEDIILYFKKHGDYVPSELYKTMYFLDEASKALAKVKVWKKNNE